MYKIIGGDQKEYGPVSFDQVAQWIRDNRANAQTLVQKEGGPWLPLGSLPEFATILSAQPAAGPAPLPGATPPLGGPTPAQPYSPPPAPGLTPGGYGMDTRERARQMVQGPATALLITGILCVVFSLIGLAGNLLGAPFQPPLDELPPELRPMFEALQNMQGPAAIISTLIGLGISVLVIFAAQKLRLLQGFALVVTATILAMVPCTSPCCCIGIPVGIWVLTVLFKPEVKAAFS